MGLRALFLRRKLLVSCSVCFVKSKVIQNTTTHTKSEGSDGCSTIWVGMGWSGKKEQRLSDYLRYSGRNSTLGTKIVSPGDRRFWPLIASK